MAPISAEAGPTLTMRPAVPPVEAPAPYPGDRVRTSYTEEVVRMDSRLTEAPGVPPPGVVACYRHAWGLLWRRFWPLLGIGLVYFLLQTPNWVMSPYSPPDGGGSNIVLAFFTLVSSLVVGVLSLVYGALVVWPVSYGQTYVYLRVVRGEAPRLGDLFAPFSRGFLATILTVFLISTGSALLLLIPALPAALFIGIAVVIGDAAVWVLVGLLVLALMLGAFAAFAFLAVRFAFVPYLVVDEGLGPITALQESWRRTGRHVWTLLGAGLLSIPIVVGGFMLFLVGVIPALMWLGLTHATLFASITAEESAAASWQGS